MRVELRQGDRAHPAEIDLEAEVRAGRLHAADEVRYAPWTGTTFRPLGAIPALHEAFDSPIARFGAGIRSARRPVGTWILVGAVVACGLLQEGLSRGALGASALARALPLAGAVGFEPYVLDGAWWGPWTSPFLHAGILHLLANLPVLAYAAFRVERALGLGGFAVVAAASMVGGAAAVIGLGDRPAVGASALAFGFWGAQIAIGFRVGEGMPAGWRGFYGMGNLVLFAPLFLAGLGAEGVSHLGHVGGLLGGVLAALVVAAESFAPARDVARRRRANLVWAAGLALLPLAGAPLAARVAPRLAVPAEPVAVAEAGVSLGLPWRMAAHPTRFGGLPAWVVSPNRDEPLFCALVPLNAPETPSPEALREAWAAALGAPLRAEEAPAPIGAAWRPHAWRLGSGARLVEHDLRRGSWLLRVGYVVAQPASIGRERLYDAVVRSIGVGEPPALAEARREASLFPQDPERAWILAHALGEAGRYGEADAAWASLASRRDGWRQEAIAARSALWAVGEALAALAADDGCGRLAALEAAGNDAGVGAADQPASAASAVFRPPTAVASVLCPGKTLSPTIQSPGSTGLGPIER